MRVDARAVAALTASTAFRLVAFYSAAILLLAVGLVAFAYWQSNVLLTRQTVQAVRAEAAAILQRTGEGEIRAAVEELSRRPGSGLYLLVGADGRPLAGNLSAWPAAAAPEVMDGRNETTLTYGDHGRHAFVTIRRPASGGRVLVGRDITEQHELAGRLRWLLLAGLLALTAATLSGGVLLAHAIQSRIDRITAASRRIMAGELAERIPLAGTGDELDRLAGSLNEMLERIEQLMHGLKEVSDNIAHDLKTPLARLRSRVEAALREPGEGAAREALGHVIEEADELIRTFNALLLVARLEAGAVEEDLETFDLGRLAKDVAELYEPAAEELGVDLVVDAPEGVLIRANRQLVGQAAANLIDNALKYGWPAAKAASSCRPRVTVRLSVADREARLEVADQGPGIAPEDRTRALKRFVRLDKSRTRPGTGLGLSVVAAVARLSRGEVRLADNNPGLVATLVLPRVRLAPEPAGA